MQTSVIVLLTLLSLRHAVISTELLSCHEEQSTLISRFGLAVLSQAWYPSCLPGGYYLNVQCNLITCFCAYMDTGKQILDSSEGKDVTELTAACPWLVQVPLDQCSPLHKYYPCPKKVARYYFNSEKKVCEVDSSSCLGFDALHECQISCGIYEPPRIQCGIGKLDEKGVCVERENKTIGRMGEKKCIHCKCEEGHELSQDRQKCIKVTRKKFSCYCEYDGLGGSTGTISKTVDMWIGAFVLQCNAPDTAKKIEWSLNGIKYLQACNPESYCISGDGRNFNLWNADYTNSGNYSCEYKTFDRKTELTTNVVFPATVDEACGTSPGINSSDRLPVRKLVGGRRTNPGMAPFVVKITYAFDAKYMCGGSVVSQSYVLTAAQCVQDRVIARLRIHAGKRRYLSTRDSYEQYSEAESVKIHKDYNPSNYHSDIALVKLKHPVYFSKMVKPICIPRPDDTMEEISPIYSHAKLKYGMAFGWEHHSNGTITDNVMEVILPLVTDEYCFKNYLELHLNFTETMVCAGGDEGRDACSGDAGGPLALWSEQRKRWYLGGITSVGGFPCGRKGWPGGYTKIWGKMRSWIYQNSDLSE